MLAIGAFAVYNSTQMPKSLFAGQLGSGVFPMLVGCGIVIVSVLLFIETLKQGKRQDEGEKGWDLTMWLSLGTLVLYVVTFEVLGFILSSALLIFLIGLILKGKKRVTLTCISVIFPAVIYFTFQELGINLPAGILPF
jgi:putative tricarboxylic transport membrane protein